MKFYNFNIIYIYFLKLFLILIKYKLYIYDITDSIAVRPVNREPVTFSV